MQDVVQGTNRQPVLRVRAEVHGTNVYGRVHMGWLMGQIDLAGSAVAERLAGGQVTTVAVNAFQFANPIQLGDFVSIYADKLRLGQKSVTLKITVETERMNGDVLPITELISTYVAIDADGRSRLI
ncbi:acyl-CoA thioesterase [Vogesella facilis]|uniref:Acyl-CoA thioesterase n=1 Tax=Vogesella facilis TaxID=1655232 RepID=A0ABV7RIM3_9NEIS